jgi:hypothetical protein
MGAGVVAIFISGLLRQRKERFRESFVFVTTRRPPAKSHAAPTDVKTLPRDVVAAGVVYSVRIHADLSECRDPRGNKGGMSTTCT